ncbi:Topoisomerase II-associated PAT1 domain-containing protein [Fasciola gigantica]|uniref:Topoisomerase II-associated PAT1 domain-containing protein n=1 Tax=Fasciola gigantica TaxID=46835 RepID=A0A504YVY7_FASGI|nr:Topoisomerase II-associated PAT1 domain-containing protein [Fasciola gigantica]
MGNELSQQTESSAPARTESIVQPWTALSLCPQTPSSAELLANKGPIARTKADTSGSPQVLSQVDREEKEATGGNVNNTEDDAVAMVAEMSLTSEEMDHINQVLSRVRQLEQREDARITKLRSELRQTEQEVRRRVSVSHQDVTVRNLVCVLCGRMQQTNKVTTETQEPVIWHICADCENDVCGHCGSVFGRTSDENKIWLCNLCQKKRRLEVSSGSWLQELQGSHRQTKALKKMLAKKPIVRTSSFTQYEEWRDRIENDTLSDTSSVDDRQPLTAKGEARRHSDMSVAVNQTTKAYHSDRKRMLSRDPSVHEQTTEIETDVDVPKTAESAVSAATQSSFSVEDRRKPPSGNFETDVSDGDIICEPMANSNEHSDFTAEYFKRRKSNLLSEGSSTLETSQDNQQEDRVVQNFRPDERPNMKQVLSNQAFPNGVGDDLSGHPNSEIAIHLRSADVTDLLLREHTVADNLAGNIWYENADDNSVQLRYDQRNIYSREMLDPYESFNSTFDEDPLYGDKSEFAFYIDKTPKIEQLENARDKWFGSQDGGMESYSSKPDPFFAANTIRRLSSDQPLTTSFDDATTKQNQQSETERLQVDSLRETELEPSKYRIFIEDMRQTTTFCTQSWPTFDSDQYASEGERLQTSKWGKINRDFRRSSASQAIGNENKISSADTTKNKSQANLRDIDLFGEQHQGDVLVTDASESRVSEVPQTSFFHPSDMVNSAPKEGDQASSANANTYDAGKLCFHSETDRVATEGNATKFPDNNSEFRSPSEMDPHKRWISDTFGPTDASVVMSKISETEYRPESDQQILSHETDLQPLEDDKFSVLRRCPNFENISGLSEQVQTHSDKDMYMQKVDNRFFPDLDSMEEESEEIYDQQDDEPTRVWYRDPPAQASVDPSMMTTQQQEDEIWASLFSPSDSLVESAKEVAAQLDLMTLAEEEASETLVYQTWDHRTSVGSEDPQLQFTTERLENPPSEEDSTEVDKRKQTTYPEEEQYNGNPYEEPLKIFYSDCVRIPSAEFRHANPNNKTTERKDVTESPVTSGVTFSPEKSQPLSKCQSGQDGNLTKGISDSKQPVTVRPSSVFTELPQASASIRRHTLETAELKHIKTDRTKSPIQNPATHGSNSQIMDPACTAPTENICTQHANTNATHGVSVVQTDQLMERETDRTEWSNGHMTGDEHRDLGEKDRQIQASTDSRVATGLTQPLMVEKQTCQGRLSPRSESTLNAKSLTPSNSVSPKQIRTQIDAQLISPPKVGVTNQIQNREPILCILPADLLKPESKRRRNVEFKALHLSKQHAPLSERGERNVEFLNKFTAPLILNDNAAAPPSDESYAQLLTEKVDDTTCCEQPISDILSPPLPVCSAVTPHRQASLIRLSAQRDRGLGLARQTLTSSCSDSPDTSDSFLSLLEINRESQIQPSLLEFSPVTHSYISSGTCCAGWSYCSNAYFLAKSSCNALVDQVITTEPALNPVLNDLDYLAVLDNSPTPPVIPGPDGGSLESDRTAGNFRRRVLEEIQEDQILVSTQPSSLEEQISVVNDALMSSSSSSRASHMFPRRRPRSTSYTYGYGRTGFEDTYDPTAEPCLYYCPERTKQRSLINVVPTNYQDYYWNETNVPSSHLNAHPSRTYPYDDDDVLSLNLTLGNITDEVGSRYAKFRPADDSRMMVYPESHSALQTKDRHRSLPSEDYKCYKEAMQTPRNTVNYRMSKYGTGPRPIQRISLRKGYQRPYRAVGEDKRWKFRNPSYASGVRDSTDNSGSNLSDDADYVEGRSQHSLPLSYKTARRALDLNALGTRTFSCGSHTDNFLSLHRPASLISARVTSQQLGGNRSLSRSTDHLNFRRTSGFWGADTSMKTLRARLAAAHSESHLDRSEDYLEDNATADRTGQRYGSLDRRLQSDHLITQQLRRQVEKHHRQLLRSLIDDKSSNTLWSPDFTLLRPPNSTSFSASSIPIMQNVLPEDTISHMLGNIDRGSGTLITTTGAPPIFSTATSRQGTGSVYGWPVTVPTSLPESVTSAFATEFTSPVVKTSPMLPNASGAQYKTSPQPLPSELPSTGEVNAMITSRLRSTQTPSTTSLLELLGNTELLQSVASDPTISSQLASLGIDLSVPQANQVTLAAVAGAVAATAIAQSGVFENSKLNDPSTSWPNVNRFEPTDKTDANIDDNTPMDHRRFLAANYVDNLPPYTVSNNDNQNLENLLQQLQNALGTGIVQDQMVAYSNQADRMTEEKGLVAKDDKTSPRNVYTSERLTNDHFFDEHLRLDSNRIGPSETIDSWLMPNSNNPEREASVNNGIGMRIVGGHIRSDGKLGAFVEEIYPRGPVDQLHGEIREGDEILEWNSIPLVGKTFEEVQSIIGQVFEETELLVRARNDDPTEREGSQPWEVPRTPTERHTNRTPKRVDALCHHHAAQQALMGMQSHSVCPHMQRQYCQCHPANFVIPSCGPVLISHTFQSDGVRFQQLPIQENHPPARGCGWEVKKWPQEIPHLLILGRLTIHHMSLGLPNHMASKISMPMTPGERVDALCHHHAAQQALMGMQSHSVCPHMQRQYLSMSPSELRHSPVAVQSSSRTRSSPTGSDSNSSNTRKSSTGQGLWMGGQEMAARDSSSTHSRAPHYSPHVSRVTESHGLEDFDADDSRRYDRQHKSPNDYKRERSGSFKLILTFDDYDQSLTVHVSRARDLPSMDLNGLADPFVKIRLHPDPTEE